MSKLPHNLISFGPDANCTLDICPLEASLLQYRPSLPVNSLFIAIFGFTTVAHLVQGLRTCSWGFMASIVCGNLLEIVGYVGRILLHDNPFLFSGFVMQIVCITVAPVFYCSAIYVLLSNVVNYVNPSISRIGPRVYYWVFIPSDIISLFLQAAGGGFSCVGSTEDDIQVGVNISLVGLIFQVITLTIFCVLFVDYVYRAWWSPARYKIQPLVSFLACVFTAVLLILLRCVYRIVELHAGYFSELFRDEALFIALESVVMCGAVIFLNFGHPGKPLNHSGKKLYSIEEGGLLMK